MKVVMEFEPSLRKQLSVHIIGGTVHIFYDVKVENTTTCDYFRIPVGENIEWLEINGKRVKIDKEYITKVDKIKKIIINDNQVKIIS